MHDNIRKFIIIPAELVNQNALCELTTYQHSYITQILDTALHELGWNHYRGFDLVTLPPTDPGNVMAHQLVPFLKNIFFNSHQIRKLGPDYILELWYAPTD